MTSGSYTAYHIYQGLHFQEAHAASAPPYRLPEYQCAHSQRGYLFQFAHMAQRNHFDAANTTCCDEPVANFFNKPQYADAARPMTPNDCATRGPVRECGPLAVSVEEIPPQCAASSPRTQRIKVKCPAPCRDLRGLTGGGTLNGRHGTFTSRGLEAGDILNLDYAPRAETLAAWRNGCSGSGRIEESVCGGFTVSRTLMAGLNFPGGCGCDCCGVSGAFAPPAMTIIAPTSVQAGWGNSISLSAEIRGDEACSGGTLEGAFSGWGLSTIGWQNSTEYHSDGVSRYVTRNPDPVGDSGNPACCGGEILWSGTDGCGSGASGTTVVVPKIAASTIVPASGTLLAEHAAAGFSGSGACSYSSGAALSAATSCLTNSLMDLERYDGYLRRRLLGNLSFSGTHACSGCCGNGTVTVTFSNGCGGTATATYDVRRAISDSNLAGYVFRCQDWWSGGARYYKAARADLRCNGTSGAFTLPFGAFYSTLAQCVASISGRSGLEIAGAGGCGALSGGSACCWYSDNRGSGYDFRSKVYSVSASRCCAMETTNGAWVFSGAGAKCCPTT
jgi:hypothetical protein